MSAPNGTFRNPAYSQNTQIPPTNSLQGSSVQQTSQKNGPVASDHLGLLSSTMCPLTWRPSSFSPSTMAPSQPTSWTFHPIFVCWAPFLTHSSFQLTASVGNSPLWQFEELPFCRQMLNICFQARTLLRAPQSYFTISQTSSQDYLIDPSNSTGSKPKFLFSLPILLVLLLPLSPSMSPPVNSTQVQHQQVALELHPNTVSQEDL